MSVLRALVWIVLVVVIVGLSWFGGWIPHGDDARGTASDSTPERRAGGLSARQFVVAGIRPHASEADVFQALGRPDLSTTAHYDPSIGDSVANWTYDGINVEIVGHAVLKLHCAATRCSTGDGVAVGDSRGHVMRVYGTPGTVETINDQETLRYAGRLAECTLNFSIRDGAVAGIDLVCDGS